MFFRFVLFYLFIYFYFLLCNYLLVVENYFVICTQIFQCVYQNQLSQIQIVLIGIKFVKVVIQVEKDIIIQRVSD